MQPSLGFPVNALTKRKYPVNGGSLGEKASLMSEASVI